VSWQHDTVARILVVEDDELLASSLVRALGYEGYLVESRATGLDALDQIRRAPPDLVVLDVMLPGMEGIEVCRRIRRESDVPVLMLTARDTVADRVHGLDSGADDYMVKPFANEELLARIRTLLRRHQPLVSQQLALADLMLDSAAHAVTRHGRHIELTALEFRLLEFFLQHRGRVLSRPQIRSAVWDLEAETSSNVVDVYVRYLRQKLGEPNLLHTVRGVGYVLRQS
jgi:two-component system response regulator MprA